MSTEQQVTDTFVYPCRTCGGTVQVTASMTQPHDCQPPDSTESLAARAWWAGHDHAAAEVERLRAENERISGAWGEVIQREQRQDNAHLFDMNALRAERDALAARLQTVRAELLRGGQTPHARVRAAIRAICALDASLDTSGDEKPGSCHCEGGCERDTFGGALLCPSCVKDGCRPYDEKPHPEGVPCLTCDDGVTVEHQPSEPESRTWHRQYVEQYDLAAAAVRIVAWVNTNGGEAELRFLGPDERRRIAVRTSRGWDYAKPGDRIVMGDKWFRVPRESRVPYEASVREFTVSPVESSGSTE